MKNPRFVRFALLSGLCLLAPSLVTLSASAQDPLRVEALLIWGTDDAQSPNPDHKPVDAGLAAKLSKAPYRWKNYFVINHQELEIPMGETKKAVPMSKHCALDIKNLGDSRAEIKLYGEGKPVSTHKEKLENGWPLILSGNATNKTAWLVVIRKQ
jgi:hypothetical protein